MQARQQPAVEQRRVAQRQLPEHRREMRPLPRNAV